MNSPDRLQQTRALLPQWGVDALLISSPSNRRWLSGFTGSAGWLLITATTAYLATDFRYWTRSQSEAPDFTLYRLQGTKATLAELLRSAGVQRVGIEGNHMSVGQFNDLQGKLGEEVTLVSLPASVESLREIKSPAELDLMRRAAALGDQAVAQMPVLARPGVSEREIAWELEKVMRDGGAEAAAFTVIVASGPNAALPHHQPGERRLQEGDAIIVDIGAQVNGYKSDLTRTFYLGNEPSEQFQEIYSLVTRAQNEALEKMRPGMTSKAIDALARDIIAAAGHSEHFGHGLGHGVGLDIHEGPRLSMLLEEVVIPDGVVVTVEPGVYIPGWGGVRIEDLVVLHEDGPELLSAAPKDPLIPLP